MYSQSYDPFGFEHPLNYGNPLSSPYEKRKRQELAQRQRMLEAERRRRAENERRKRKQEKLSMEGNRREMEAILRQHEEDEALQWQHLALLVGRQHDEASQNSSLSASHVDDIRQEWEAARCSHDDSSSSATYPPRTIVLRPDGKLYTIFGPVASSGSGKNYQFRRRSDTGYSSNLSESDNEDNTTNLNRPEEFEDDGQLSQDEVALPLDDASDSPPHIIAVEDVSDDEDDELRELNSILRNGTPGSDRWIEPNDSFQSNS